MQKPIVQKELLTSKPNAEETIPLVFGSDLAMAAQHNREQRIHSLDYPGRFEKMGLIASGGMGEIHHVYDHAMNRSVALKTLKDPWKDDAIVMDAFLTEARLTAQLHHPGIIPVHEYGFLHNGGCYYTMPIVQGKTLSEHIEAVHLEPIALRKRHIHTLIDYLLKAAEAIAYAHAQQILHQDIKPSNIMVGEHGEVYVVDWGLARELLNYDSELTSSANGGTPAYMPPERFKSQTILTLNSDVYSLGATLYKILCGEAPKQNAQLEPNGELSLLRTFFPLQHYAEEGFPIPSALIAITECAMHDKPELRYPNAEGFCQVLRDWLHGELRKREATQMLESAQSHIERAQRLHQESIELTKLGHQKLSGIPKWASENEKKEGWNYLDRAARLQADRDLEWLAHERVLYSALSQAPDLIEAHAHLAKHYIAKLHYAETRKRSLAAEQALEQLKAHVNALPAHHPQKATWLAYIIGQSNLKLDCSHPVRFRIHKYQLQNRRLTPMLSGIGKFPIENKLLEMGSYLITVESPDIVPTCYPFEMYRRQAWSSTPPDHEKPQPIRLMRADAAEENDLFIPAGWTYVGDPENTPNALPFTGVWVEDFVIQKTPVTNRAYIEFLNDLIDNGRTAEALDYAPRERGGTIGEKGALIYGQKENGHFILRPDSDGDIWQEDWPVIMVDWETAQAFATWYAEKTQKPWRLPHEIEWEKAARGVDMRRYPWGNHHDPSWCNMLESNSYNPLVGSVHSFSNDTSVYGLLGAAGNVSDWCSNGYSPNFVPVRNRRINPDVFPVSQKVIRGGSWAKRERDGMCEVREYRSQEDRISTVGFRLARHILPDEYHQ
ncbi:MAG: bifunctional serine/threonine-protein kinase/formylglycine-generating enzyme family protein [Myxococcota bacterium]|nr:bifunctional serine/threonine-protein kinase/formylglycine-generating enzyme family protein [Myxococcota bacterium]